MIWRLLAGFLLRLRQLFWRVVYRSYRTRYSIDPNFRFNGAGIQLYGEGSIELGPGGYIGEFSTLQAATGESIRVGTRCGISHNVRIYTTSAPPDQDFRLGQEKSHASVSIGDGSWIGVNCYIGPGVHIGANSIVSANSVVLGSIPANEIWGGVPARRLRRKQGTGDAA